MITNRKLISILTIIAVLFLLFQGTLAFRESLNHYENNNFRVDTGLMAADAPAPETFAPDHRVLFLGDGESEEAKTVEEWACYVRYTFTAVSGEEGLLALNAAIPPFVCVQGSVLTEEEIPYLQNMTANGIHLFFTSLPDAAFLSSHADLMDLLGIQEVRAEETALSGVRLYNGFLLGGERVYEAEKKEEQEKQDLTLTVPWYVTGAGTETYMNGLFPEEEMKALPEETTDELLPALIWRHSIGSSRVFAVAGDYMEDRQIGIGLLSAALSRTSSYAIYPVINAQEVTLISFPTAANENEEVMRQVYGRNMLQAESRLVLPRIESLGLQKGYSFTGAFAVRLLPGEGGYEAGWADTFLSTMNEMSCELGLSFVEDDSLSLAEKAAETRDFLQSQGVTYEIGSTVVKPSDLTGDTAFLDDELFSKSADNLLRL